MNIGSNVGNNPQTKEMTDAKMRQIAHLKPFPKGISGNPKGRAKSLAKYVRKMTDNGREMVNTMIAIMRGDKIPGAFGNPTYQDIRAACEWLWMQIFGKTPIPEDDDVYDVRRIVMIEISKKIGNNGQIINAESHGQDLATQ